LLEVQNSFSRIAIAILFDFRPAIIADIHTVILAEVFGAKIVVTPLAPNSADLTVVRFGTFVVATVFHCLITPFSSQSSISILP
jgi:hypothetical protein